MKEALIKVHIKDLSYFEKIAKKWYLIHERGLNKGTYQGPQLL